jgi:hypothetical protein
LASAAAAPDGTPCSFDIATVLDDVDVIVDVNVDVNVQLSPLRGDRTRRPLLSPRRKRGEDIFLSLSPLAPFSRGTHILNKQTNQEHFFYFSNLQHCSSQNHLSN